MKFSRTHAQRAGLGIAGMFYGQLIAALCLAVAILARNLGSFAFLRHNYLFALKVILAAVGLVGLTTLLAWLLTALPFILAWPPQRFRRLGPFAYLGGAGVGFAACLILWLEPAVRTHSLHSLPKIPLAALCVTFAYGWIVDAAGLWRYLRFAAQADRLSTRS